MCWLLNEKLKISSLLISMNLRLYMWEIDAIFCVVIHVLLFTILPLLLWNNVSKSWRSNFVYSDVVPVLSSQDLICRHSDAKDKHDEQNCCCHFISSVILISVHQLDGMHDEWIIEDLGVLPRIYVYIYLYSFILTNLSGYCRVCLPPDKGRINLWPPNINVINIRTTCILLN